MRSGSVQAAAQLEWSAGFVRQALADSLFYAGAMSRNA